MPQFWKRRRDHVESLLEAHRPEPRDDYVASVLERLDSEPRRSRGFGVGRRLLVAAVLTALAMGAAVAAGGVQTTRHSVSGLVQVAKNGFDSSGHQTTYSSGSFGTKSAESTKNTLAHDPSLKKLGGGYTIAEPQGGTKEGGTKWGGMKGIGVKDPWLRWHISAGDKQYIIPICHHVDFTFNGYHFDFWIPILIVSPTEMPELPDGDFVIDEYHHCPPPPV